MSMRSTFAAAGGEASIVRANPTITRWRMTLTPAVVARRCPNPVQHEHTRSAVFVRDRWSAPAYERSERNRNCAPIAAGNVVGGSFDLKEPDPPGVQSRRTLGGRRFSSSGAGSRWNRQRQAGSARTGIDEILAAFVLDPDGNNI